jgi:hypothetical protein
VPTRNPKCSCLSILLCGLVFGAGGCAHNTSSGSTGGGGSSGGPTISITGNWQFVATPTSGATPFSNLAGFLNESGDSPTASNFLTAALQAQSTTCYADSANVSLDGGVYGSHVGLTSFSNADQILTVSATMNAAGTGIAGTYSITGGCADGEQGSLAGTLYSPLMGSYGGAVMGNNLSQSIQLSLSQSAEGDGVGDSSVTGSATFQGFPCFSKGTINVPNGYVLGSSANFTVSTNEAGGSQVVMTGTTNPSGDTLVLSSINVVGGNCSGSVGEATLQQK